MLKINIKKYAAILLTAAFLGTSCSLDENLYSQPGDENVSPQEKVQLLTNGIYNYNRYFSYTLGNNWLMSTGANTDEFFLAWGGNDPTAWGGKQNFLDMDASHHMLGEHWDRITLLISHTNEVVNAGKNLPESDKKLLGEARFWRAFAYYKAYTVFGPLPLNLGDKDISNGIERATAEQMKSFIESEMLVLETENLLPESHPASEWGRPTIWAVKAFLARYYLNEKIWDKASDYARQIIKSENFDLEKNYQDIFGVNRNKEVILAINQIREADKGNKYVSLSLDRPIIDAYDIRGVSGSNGYGMSVQFYQTFNPKDVRIKPYDPETQKGIIVSGIVKDKNGNPAYKDDKENPQTVEKALSRVLSFKWPLATDIPRGEDAPYDMPLYRLGEIYLTYAEAQAELALAGNSVGTLSQAEFYINLIRNRAGLSDTPVSLEGKTPEQIRNIILDERGWELYHEGYRREDLVRNGKLLEKVNEKYRFYFGVDMPWKNDTKRELLLIPTKALQLNPKLVQNPTY